jgi:hypothetical protein
VYHSVRVCVCVCVCVHAYVDGVLYECVCIDYMYMCMFVYHAIRCTCVYFPLLSMTYL